MDELYDPRDEAFQADPYPTYARLREEAPVYMRYFDRPDGQHIPIWALSRWDDCISVLRDPRFSAQKPLDMLPLGAVDQPPEEQHPLVRAFNALLLFRDPPDHTRLRNLVNKAFTTRTVRRLRPRIEALVDELLAPGTADGGMDLIEGLAVPLPIIVIAELLGVPGEDHARLKVWSDHAAMLIDGTLRDEHLATALPSFVELVEYLRRTVERRRRAPRDDLISALVAAQDADDALDDHEILATCALILGAGHETTTNLIGNGMLALLRDPAAWGRLAREPGLLPTAVEELLRFDSPVQVTSRIAREPVVIGGHRIPPGVEVNTLIGSANRDPAQFPDPDRLVLDRADNRHLSFGHGAHFCLGAPLARLEGHVAIGGLLARFPAMKLELDEPPRRPGFVLRGRSSLPVRLG
jgi:pimeloyl-[acyl-carrier protein] synthase